MDELVGGGVPALGRGALLWPDNPFAIQPFPFPPRPGLTMQQQARIPTLLQQQQQGRITGRVPLGLGLLEDLAPMKKSVHTEMLAQSPELGPGAGYQRRFRQEQKVQRPYEPQVRVAESEMANE